MAAAVAMVGGETKQFPRLVGLVAHIEAAKELCDSIATRDP